MGYPYLSKLVRVLTLSLILAPTSLMADKTDWSYSVDYIRGEGDVEGIKLAVQYHTDYLKKFSEYAELYVESSINFWEYGRTNERDTNFVLAMSPVILHPIGEVASRNIYVEFGIGISLLSDTQFAGKDVGSHYQFEDRLGLVMKLGKKQRDRLALRYFHYSNAGLSDPNPGLDFISLSYLRFF